MKMMKRMLAAVLTASMLLAGSAAAAGPVVEPVPADGADAPQDEAIWISLTEASSQEVTFTSPDYYTFASVQDQEITWTLERLTSYAEPEGGVDHPLRDEDEMYPNELDEIVLGQIDASHSSYLKISNVTTTVEAGTDGSTLTLTFDVAPMISRGNESAPHSNGGAYLDVCGTFLLKAEDAAGQEIGLGKDVTVEIEPYASFHTMWDIYEELDRLAQLGDDDDSTARPYVSLESMGTSNAGYDMPYLIVAKDSQTVEDWLALCERAETEPDEVLEELEAGALEYQVPVVYSNIHANEVAAADGVLEFAKLLVEQETIDYTKLTGFTPEGEAKRDLQRETQGLYLPELVADKTNFLGSIWPSDDSQLSGKVEGFDDYYTSEETTVTVDSLLDDVFFLLVPEENVEGRMYVTRTSSGGYDLNRDNSFQTQAETQNMQRLIAAYDPVTLLELHGQVTGFQVEPCTPPHEPNVEYDLLSEHLMTGGEAFGAAAVANNDDWQSYVIPMRDYLTSDQDGDPYWEAPWDDMSTSYTPQFAMLQGCVAYTVELPAYSDSARTAATYGLVGLSDYVAANKESYFYDLVSIYARCVDNEDTDAQVAPWLADAHDVEGAEAALFRPAYDGEGENGQFFPECYIIPLDSAHQTNLQAAYDMIEWLTRNDVKVGITGEAFSYEGETYPAGTMIVSMYQAKRAVANGVLYDGTLIRNWTDLYSEGITAFNYTRGFDMIACAKPDAYEEIADAVDITLDSESAAEFLEENAASQFSGRTGGDVIISNASEDSTAAVNALLQAGEQVGMITEGDYEGDFICSYDDWLSVCEDYVLTGTGVVEPDVTAYSIEKAPSVYISGTASALRESSVGYIYTNLVASSYSYHYDRMAMELMGFQTTEDASQADAVIGATSLDADGLAAVQSGVPYVGYTSSAVRTVSRELLPTISTASTSGMDCLGHVIYPEKTLVNASYISDGDDVLYGYGTSYFTAVPEGAKILVQRDGTEPMEGFLNGDEESYQAFLNGIQGFSYQGLDQDGNTVDITLFANTLTNKAHQRDEYAFISNAIFASLLTDEAYQVTERTGGGSSSNSKPAIDPNAGQSGSAGTAEFSDVPASAYYADAVEWAVGQGVTSGTTQTTFSPSAVCTRAQTVTFLWRAAGSPEPQTTVSPFTDVSSDAYYYDAVLWAVEQGITTGTTATTFTPDATVTRAQTVAFLWRAAGTPASTGTNAFSDVSGDAYYHDAVLWAVDQGVTNGTTATTFAPAQGCTRAQTVTMLYRCYGQ